LLTELQSKVNCYVFYGLHVHSECREQASRLWPRRFQSAVGKLAAACDALTSCHRDNRGSFKGPHVSDYINLAATSKRPAARRSASLPRDAIVATALYTDCCSHRRRRLFVVPRQMNDARLASSSTTASTPGDPSSCP